MTWYDADVAKPLESLLPGEQIRITSLSGNVYDATVLVCGREKSGLFVRSNGRVGRLLPERLDWASLERVGQTDPITKGDEVIVSPIGGTERRGYILGPLDERIDIELKSGGGLYSVPLARISKESFRLLYGTNNPRPGDEFMVTSRSGRQVRGTCVDLLQGLIVATVLPNGDRVRISIERLDLSTLFVLIPVPIHALGCSPVG
jgi:hypothetical protein